MRIKVLSLMFLIISIGSIAQQQFVMPNSKSKKIPFNLINDLIIIPVEINGIKLSFLLDTGVTKPVLFNLLNLKDTLDIKNSEKIFLRGLGEGSYVKAIRSKNNLFKIGEAINLNQEVFIVYNQDLNFSTRLGVPVHGIVGHSIFKDYIIQINYSRSFLRLYKHDYFSQKRLKRYSKVNLEFYNNKPFIKAEISTQEKTMPVKLLIDTGGSDALWLFKNDSLGITYGDKYFNDFLGHGLSGSVYGKRSKIKQVSFGDYNLENVNVAYPDKSSVMVVSGHKARNGSISGNILKRFNHYFNYNKKQLFIKKNGYFNEAFNYNLSGIELKVNGFILDFDSNADIGFSLKPAFTVVELRENSPAKNAGVQLNDIILSINGKSTKKISLQDIMGMFYEMENKNIKLTLDRNGRQLEKEFVLKKIF